MRLDGVQGADKERKEKIKKGNRRKEERKDASREACQGTVLTINL